MHLIRVDSYSNEIIRLACDLKMSEFDFIISA